VRHTGTSITASGRVLQAHHRCVASWPRFRKASAASHEFHGTEKIVIARPLDIQIRENPAISN
jgi:hypothetical protein